MVRHADERSAANGITNIARSIGLLLAPLLLGHLASAPPRSLAFNMPWFICGALKIVYDLTLYATFQSKARAAAGASGFGGWGPNARTRAIIPREIQA